MSEKSNKTYRVRTNVNSDKYLDIQLDQDYENFEFLTLKLSRENIYKLHTANYGCIAGRVLANDAFGIPNAKISVFIATSESEDIDPILYGLYPYETASDEDSNNIRYNTLPDNINDDICHQNIGTFPNKRLVLDDNNVLEIYDTYYKYTTVSNDAGDYMIFGVPVGQQTVHVDIDLSDIGRLSQKPRDLIFKGYNVNQFESTSKFKKDTNLNNLVQVISQNATVDVKPFWGDESEATVAVTRNDIKIQYKFDTYCVFIGSVMTDNVDSAISKRCIPADKQGRMDEMTTGQGIIEMIRKTSDGGVETFSIQGNRLIDGTGTWCYQIPMNLDYVGTDEYGNIVATNDPTKGIATRSEVRFRISMTDTGRQTNKLPMVLVPNNPSDPSEMDYAFGSYTKDSSYRSLFYNNVYTVKSFIPRIQKGNNQFNRRYTAIKSVNAPTDNNRFPYNNMRVNVGFMFFLMCAILKTLIRIIRIINKWRSFWKSNGKNCIVIGDGLCPDLEGWYFAPGCKGDAMLKKTLEEMESDTGDNTTTDTTADPSTQLDDMSSVEYRNKESNTCLTGEITYLMECVEINLAMEYNVVNFDFYNDWVNGTIYLPKWYGAVRRKTSLLFGLIKIKAKTLGCLEDTVSLKRRYTQQCALSYKKDVNNFYSTVASPIGCASDSSYKCHKANGRYQLSVLGDKGGLVHPENTLSEDKVYYMKPCEFKNTYGDYYRKCNFFATDIVLLGSLSSTNDDGIPLIYNNIPSTTYQLPTNLALTNMDSESYNFATDDNTACTGKKIAASGVTRVANTADAYNIWSNTTDAPEDETEAAITEAAGIDWGYLGPDQYNNYDNLYNPSGHFLGIGCAKAETTIKSCVNLQRACELGAELSQRHEMVSSVTSGGVEYYYVTPSGLINRYDIGDAHYRRVFATLNYNGLKTKLDEDTKYPKYEFVSSMVNGFDGSLNEYVDSSVDYNGGRQVGQTEYYKLTNEDSSVEYERFRLGVKDDSDEEILSKYLVQNTTNNTVALPTYENSFYFYFGLQQGHSAYDRLLNDYYSICERDSEGVPQLDLDGTTSSVGCDKIGTATFTVSNYNGVYSIRVYNSKDNKYEKFSLTTSPLDEENTIYLMVNTSGSTIFNTKSKHFKINGLDSVKYKISITTYVDKTEYSHDVEIGDNPPEILQTIKPTVTDFTEEHYNSTDTCDTGYCGYIDFVLATCIDTSSTISAKTQFVNVLPLSVTSITINNTNGFTNESIRSSSRWTDTNSNTYIVDVTTTIPTIRRPQQYLHKRLLRIYVRDGNMNYYVTYKIACDDADPKTYTMTTPYYVKMDAPLDYYIGTPMVTGRQLENANISTSSYNRTIGPSVNLFLPWIYHAMSSTTLTDIQKWIIQKSMINSYPLSQNINHKIPCGYCLGGGAPYNVYDKYGHGEKLDGDKYMMHDGRDDGYQNIKATLVNGKDGYSVNHNYFKFSTCKINWQDRGLSDGDTWNNGVMNIIYDDATDFKNFAKYCKYGQQANCHALPYYNEFNVINTVGSGITAEVLLPSIYMPMRSYTTYWLNRPWLNGVASQKPYVHFNVENGVTYKSICIGSITTPYVYTMGDTEISLINGDNNFTKTIKQAYSYTVNPLDGTNTPLLPPYRSEQLLKYDGTTTRTHKDAKCGYLMSDSAVTYDSSKIIKCAFSMREGIPRNFNNTQDLQIRTISDNIECKFIETVTIQESTSTIYGLRVVHDSLSENSSSNVRYYIANKNFIDNYDKDNRENYCRGIFNHIRTSAVTNPSSDGEYIWQWTVTGSSAGVGFYPYGVSFPKSDVTAGLECYFIGIANPLTAKSGDLSDTTSDFYKAYYYRDGIDDDDNFTSIIKIWKTSTSN